MFAFAAVRGLFLFPDEARRFVLLDFALEFLRFLAGKTVLFLFFASCAFAFFGQAGFFRLTLAQKGFLFEGAFGLFDFGEIGLFTLPFASRLFGEVRLARRGFLGFAFFALHRLAAVAQFLDFLLLGVLVPPLRDLCGGRFARGTVGQAALGFPSATVDLFGAPLFLLELAGVSLLFGFLDFPLSFRLGLLRFRLVFGELAELFFRLGFGVHLFDDGGFVLLRLARLGFLGFAFEPSRLLLLHSGVFGGFLFLAAAFRLVGDPLQFEDTVGFERDVDRAADPPLPDGQFPLRVQLVDRHILLVGSIVDVEIVGFVFLKRIEELGNERFAVLRFRKDHFVGDLRRHIVAENAVLHGESRKHLVEEPIVDLFGGVLHRQFVSRALVTLDKLPERDALAQVAVLVDGVGVHNGGTDIVFPHRFGERRIGVARNHLFDMFEPIPEFGLFARVFRGSALDLRGGGDLHIQIDFSLDRRRLEPGLVGENRGRRRASVLADRVVTARNEDVQPVDQRIDETVFVGLHRLVPEDVQDLRRGDGVALDAADVVGVLGEVTETATGDIVRQFDREDGVVLLDEPTRLADHVVERNDAILDDLDPGLVEGFAHHLAFQSDLPRPATDHILHRGEYVDVTADVGGKLVHSVVNQSVFIPDGGILRLGDEGIARRDVPLLVRLGYGVGLRKRRSPIRRVPQFLLFVHDAPFRRFFRLFSGSDPGISVQNIFCRRSR